MRKLIHIFMYKMLAWLKTDMQHSILSFLKSFGSSIIYIVFAFGAYVFSKELLYFALIKFKLGLFLVHEFISIILFVFFLSVNAGNIIVSYSTLFKSEEVFFLFTKPIESSKIFIIKFFDNFFYSSGTLFFVMLAFMAGYADYFELNPFYILFLIIFNFFPFMITAASLGSIVLLVILKVASRIGLRNAFYILAGLYFSSIAFFLSTSSPVTLVKKVLKHYPTVDLNFESYVPEIIKYLPNRWLASSFYWLQEGNIYFSFSYSVLQVCLAFLMLGSAVYLGGKWYRELWLKLPDFLFRKKIQRINKSKNIEKQGLFSTLLRKEVNLFLREPSQVIHSVVLIILLLIFMSSVSNPHLYEGKDSQIRAIILLSVYVFDLFLISTLALRFVFPIISLEGKAFWKMRTSPNRLLNILSIKLTSYFFLIFLLSLLITSFIMKNFDFELIVFTQSVNSIIVLTIIILNYSLGGIFAKYDESNPIRLASSQGASITFLVTVFYMVFIILILYSPFQDYFEFISGHLSFGELNFALPFLIISGISIGVIISAAVFFHKFIKMDY